MANKVTFHLVTTNRDGTRYMSARVVLPSGKEYHVGYHPGIGADGQRDGLNFGFNGVWADGVFTETTENNPIWIEDKDSEDMFCSKLFGELTGRYPYEVEEWITPNEDYAPFPEGIE